MPTAKLGLGRSHAWLVDAGPVATHPSSSPPMANSDLTVRDKAPYRRKYLFRKRPRPCSPPFFCCSLFYLLLSSPRSTSITHRPNIVIAQPRCRAPSTAACARCHAASPARAGLSATARSPLLGHRRRQRSPPRRHAVTSSAHCPPWRRPHLRMYSVPSLIPPGPLRHPRLVVAVDRGVPRVPSRSTRLFFLPPSIEAELASHCLPPRRPSHRPSYIPTAQAPELVVSHSDEPMLSPRRTAAPVDRTSWACTGSPTRFSVRLRPSLAATPFATARSERSRSQPPICGIETRRLPMPVRRLQGAPRANRSDETRPLLFHGRTASTSSVPSAPLSCAFVSAASPDPPTSIVGA